MDDFVVHKKGMESDLQMVAKSELVVQLVEQGNHEVTQMTRRICQKKKRK